jgi:hypothetical protein
VVGGNNVVEFHRLRAGIPHDFRVRRLMRAMKVHPTKYGVSARQDCEILFQCEPQQYIVANHHQ